MQPQDHIALNALIPGRFGIVERRTLVEHHGQFVGRYGTGYERLGALADRAGGLADAGTKRREQYQRRTDTGNHPGRTRSIGNTSCVHRVKSTTPELDGR